MAAYFELGQVNMMPHKVSPALKFRNPSLRSPYWGLQSIIARRLAVTRPIVCQVWNGKKRSRRIETEIALALKNPSRYMRLHGTAAA
jgi:hypothetical protein